MSKASDYAKHCRLAKVKHEYTVPGEHEDKVRVADVDEDGDLCFKESYLTTQEEIQGLVNWINEYFGVKAK